MRGPEGGRISTGTIGRVSTAPRISLGGPRFSGNVEARGISSGPRLLTGRFGATRVPGLEPRIPTVALNQQPSSNINTNRTPGLGRLEGIRVIPQQQSRLAGNENGRTPSARQLPKMGEFIIHPLASLPGDTAGRVSPGQVKDLLQQQGSNFGLGDRTDRSVRIVEMGQRPSHQVAPANPEFTVPEITTVRPITIRSEIKSITTELREIESKKVSTEPAPTQPTIDLRLSTEAMQTFHAPEAEIKAKTSGAEFSALLRRRVVEAVRSRNTEGKRLKTSEIRPEREARDTLYQRFVNIYSYNRASGHWDDLFRLAIQNPKNALTEIKNAIRKMSNRRSTDTVTQTSSPFDLSELFEPEKKKKRKQVVDQTEINTGQILGSDIEQSDTFVGGRMQLKKRVQNFISQRSTKIGPALSENSSQQLRLVRIDQPVLRPEPSTNSPLPNPGGGGGSGGGGGREIRIKRRKRLLSEKEIIPVKGITPVNETEKAKKLLPVSGYPVSNAGYDKKIEHHPILHFTIDDPVQGRRVNEWSQAVRTAFASSRSVEAVPMNVIVSALPKISKPTESTLVTQLNRKRDGSNRDWRRELFTQVKVTMSQAFTTGIEVIRRMPAVILDLMGVDAKSEDVIRVMNGDNVAESALA